MYKNYKLIKTEELKDINSVGTLLVHEKSQAKVLLLSNDDENKMFCIGFRTPPYDDTGLPHILEHSVLCGSRKFPVKEPFVELMKGSLNTFLNAMTYPDKTIYPVASCNEQDFRNLMDVYMDAVLYPNIHKKEEIFRQEGWHYELESKDGELTYNGVVYNEMKGAFSSPDGILGRESLNALFPDTAYGVESGGNPDSIPTLTYENFTNFHKKYYHPSNSYIIIYGNTNMEEQLEWLDKEYLSAFDAIQIDSSLKEQTPFKETLEKIVEYPVTKEQGTKKKTFMSYNVAFPKGMSMTDAWAFDIISTVLLDAAGAPLKMALLKEQIGDVVGGSFDSGIMQPVFSVTTQNADEDDKERFVKTIEETLVNLVNNKLNEKALKAALNSYEFKLREADFGGMSKGLIYAMNAFNTWLYDDEDAFSSFEFTKIFNELKTNIGTTYYENLIKKYLLNNTHKSVVVVKPSLEVAEAKEKALKAKLAAYKDSLTDEEVEKIIEDTKKLKAYQATPDKKEDLDTIPLLTKEDLSYDVLPLSNIEYTIEGVKVLHHDFATSGIGYIRLFFNVLNLPKKYLPYLGVFKSLLGKLDTASHTYETLEQDININTGGINYSYFTTASPKDYHVGLLAGANTLYDNIGYSLDIIKEVINTTNFEMKDRVKELLAMNSAYMQQMLVGRGHVQSLTRALSYTDPVYYFNDEVSGIRYFDTITNLLKNYDEKFEELVTILQEMTKLIFTKENLIVSFTGETTGFNKLEEALPEFIKALPNEALVKEPFIFEPMQLNEGFKAPYDVQYVALTGNYLKAGLDYHGSLQVFQNILSTDYLWTKVRVLGGAYGCMCGFGLSGSTYFVSYRDPNLTKTLDVYHEITNYINNFEATSEEMTKYIIGAVGTYDYPKSPAVKGARSFTAYLNKQTIDDFKREKAEIINTTVEDVKNALPYVEAIFEQNNICVIGNEKRIEEAKDIFKETKMLLK